MLKQLIQTWHFKKKLYPEFLKQLNNAFKENKALFLHYSNDDDMELYVIIGDSLMHFKKIKNQELLYTKTILFKDLDKMIEIEADAIKYQNDLREFINKIKTNGQMTLSSQVVDYLNTILKGSVPYYKFTRKEIASIYERVLSDHHYFFTHNYGATMLNISANKWLD